MKKRTVRDFIALYAPEDEEKLVLIQDGISADKTFLDTFWAAHTHALAMADVQTGEVISGRCYLSWPLTDNERENGDYSKLFSKGQIYRIKARAWKGDALSEPQWYVTEVLEEGVSCPALEEIWAEYTKPILLKDEVLGTLTLDREMSMFTGICRWMGKEVQISLDVEIEKKASWTRVTNVMKNWWQIRKPGISPCGRWLPRNSLLRPTNGWRTMTRPTGTRRKTPSLRMSSPGVSCSLSLQYLRVGVLPPGMRTTICSGAMWSR